ncbi:HAD family phosphatase [Polaribacter sp. WD7]|uniref:HAD-IA family hydrolase n=1 Tax=Polaribacter sp. WD7 TaxID=2269061 RepID=UPI000DF3E274|nr:HAD-IA family hydrolase [Polaribacter sp. WD7]RCS27536.1 HAD family phosphatase [Polaribacter sp. WD7]
MIKNIIFDFGDIFINLDKKRFALEMRLLGISEENKEVKFVLDQYEMGLISTEEIAKFFVVKNNISPEKFMKAWNSILLDFPLQRLAFLKELFKSKKYRLFLLSNTNDLHISWIQKNWGQKLYQEFKDCYEKFYLSHEIHFRKPNLDIYQFVLQQNNLLASETLFIDDTKVNTDAASTLGIHVWNLKPGTEDVTELYTKKADLF